MLWVSDPHFSDSYHDFSRGPGLSRTNLSEAIRRDLEYLGKQSIGGLLISGDLTWQSARAEYEQAAQFIGDVMSWAKLTPSEILVCPGNHDLAFSSEPWAKGTPATETTDKSAFEYKRFYEELYEVKPTTYLSSGRRFLVPNGGLVDVARLRTLGVETYFSRLYTLEGKDAIHISPDSRWVDPPAGFITVVPRDERKPNPGLLLDICRHEGADPSSAFYLGDSLVRDVAMAKEAGVTAIWARYGTKYDPINWTYLVKITHWTDEDVEREKSLKTKYGKVVPDHTIDAFVQLKSIVLGR